MKRRLLNFLIALDQLAYVLLTLGRGSPDETLSAAAWRTEQEGHILGRIFRPLIDLLARPWERDHCRKSFESERDGRHLPNEYQQ
jgi:tRNA(Ile)-lysidine synthase TilS/MesJ